MFFKHEIVEGSFQIIRDTTSFNEGMGKSNSLVFEFRFYIIYKFSSSQLDL